jgi:uncharacterized membrane protein YidH (DUF202 family)
MACASSNGNGIINAKALPQACADQPALNHILTSVFTIIGAVALLMLVIAGFRYVLSQGEPQKSAEIRRQMIYIAVGLVIVGSADAIVTFVLRKAG